MGTGSDIYRFFFLLHIVAVVLGFGPLLLNGIYGRLAKARGGSEGLAISQANEQVSKVAEKFVFAVPLFGIALVLLSDDAWAFDQAWVSLSFLLYIIALAIALAVLVPSHRRINELSAELVGMGPAPEGAARQRPPQLAQLEQLGKRQAMFGGITGLLFLIIVALMIWKPGV